MTQGESLRSGGRASWTALAIILSVSAVLAYVYFRQVGSPYLAERMNLHGRIIDGTAESPYRYRVLVPFVAEGLSRALGVVLPTGKAFRLAYAICDLAAVFLLLGMLHRYLRAWFTSDQALVGVLFAAATMPMALRDHYFQPWSVLDAALFAAGLLCVRERRYVALAAITAFAAFNRETAVFIPLAFLVAGVGGKGEDGADRPTGVKAALLFAGYAAIWAAVSFGLRLALGPGARVISVEDLIAGNTIRPAIFLTIVHVALIFGAFWIFAALGFRRAPAFAKRTVLLAPPYLAAVAVWGVWHEVRLFLPLYAIVVPLALSFLYRAGNAPSLSDP